MKSPGTALCQFWNSSIGKKIIVALTGAALVAFLIGHVAGNLLVYQGRDATNDYAEFLHHMLHGQGVWIFRIGLLVMFVVHVLATVQLTMGNRAARINRYASQDTVVASVSSRIMIWSGVTILAFLIFHLLHFTVRVDQNLAELVDPVELATGHERHDTYGMVVKGFQNIPVSLFYILSMTLLCSHLSHGVSSIFQTLGLRSRTSQTWIKCLGWILAVAIWAGFVSIPLAVLGGFLKFNP